MEYKDYYKILGVERGASSDDIRKSYRRLAKKYHPDVSKEANAESRFKEVGEAYEVLKDEEKRSSYDRLGANWKQGEQFQPPPDWGSQFGGGGRSAGGGDFSDFFSSIFGGGGGGFNAGGGRGQGHYQRQAAKGADQTAKIQIDLEDALQGAKRTFTLNSSTGQRTLTVNIPKGVKAGQKIRLGGQGSPGMAGAGDLLLEVEFNPHPFYKVDGRDLHLNVPIAPWEAALGGSIKVPTPGGGSAGIKIPAGSRSGRKMRLKEKGIPGKPAGDLYLVLEITTPPADSEAAKDFYAKMAEEMDFNPRAALGV